jgi:hypothetical protein
MEALSRRKAAYLGDLEAFFRRGDVQALYMLFGGLGGLVTLGVVLDRPEPLFVRITWSVMLVPHGVSLGFVYALFFGAALTDQPSVWEFLSGRAESPWLPWTKDD